MELLRQLADALGDRYRVERELGSGGMAVVFLAEDLKHHRPVAIKLLRPELSAVVGSERFLREIQLAATLQHPHILPLYDSGQAGSLLYYVMPFAEGESLRQLLARESQLGLEDALRIAREVGSALEYAHQHGVIHRDIKPANIMLSAGQAVVADFGIARAVSAAGTEQLTSSGMVVGTPQYMSPEQAGAGSVDGRADQYSLACTLYEMLIGQPPFTGPSAHVVLARHSLEAVPGLRIVRDTVPVGVEAAIMKAMAKMPADRFVSMAQFLDALVASGPQTIPSAPPIARSGRAASRVRRAIVAAAGAVLLSGLGWWIVAARMSRGVGAGPPRLSSVAVLPFQDTAGGPDSSYLGDGMTEGLIADLAEIGSLKVISRASGMAADQGATQSLADLGKSLGADAVVKGSIRKLGDSVRVSVRLLQARDSTLLFAREYLGGLGELPDLQREITLAITGSIKADLKGAERNRLDVRREVDRRAYDDYLRGRFYLDRGEMEQARALFEHAGQVAPSWAPPYVGLANYYTALPFYTNVAPAEVLPKARAALAQALRLDETLAEAHAANAYIRAYYEWDWRAAEQEFRRAIELRPNYADAYFSYSRFLASRRRLDEAIAQLGRAVELDPLSLSLQANRALLEYFAGRYDEAERRLREVLKTDSTDVLAKWGLALVAEQQGRSSQAIALLEPIVGSSMLRQSSLGHAYAVAGRTDRARRVLAKLQETSARSYVPAYWFAVVHAGLGNRDEALHHLERAYQERSTVLAYVLIDPRLASLRNDPRFVALTRRLEGE